MKLSIASIGLILVSFLMPNSSFAAQTNDSGEQTVTVYSYWNPKSPDDPIQLIKPKFEKLCNCTLNFVKVGDGVSTLNRLKLEGKNTKADVILGIDSNLLEQAETSGMIVPHGLEAKTSLVPNWQENEYFIPFDYSYFVFMYNKDMLPNPPTSFKELLADPKKFTFIMSDPRFSTPGLGMVLWVKKLYGDKAGEVWKQLSKNILTVTPNWSESYSLYLKGETPMILGYLTSPAATMLLDKKYNYLATVFDEGNYVQVEVAALTIKGKSNKNAQLFLDFIRSPDFQDAIPEHNWMFPAYSTSYKLTTFEKMPQVKSTLKFDSKQLTPAFMDAIINEWLDGSE